MRGATLTMDGAARITAERQRQIEAEGYTPEHDAGHIRMELVRAAKAYLLAVHSSIPDAIRSWPWQRDGFMVSTPLRSLEKAGALIAAEIDRRLAAGEQ